jgi:hypothetical protein
MAGIDVAKAFNRLHAQVASAVESKDEDLQRKQKEKTEEEILREQTKPMTAADCVPRVLLAWKDRDYFRCGRH